MPRRPQRSRSPINTKKGDRALKREKNKPNDDRIRARLRQQEGTSLNSRKFRWPLWNVDIFLTSRFKID